MDGQVLSNADLKDWDRIAAAFASVAGSPLDHISELLRAPLWESLDPVAGLNVLDIGCGGGGLLRDLYKWAGRDGYKLSLLGIDEDPRAIAFAAIGSWPKEISRLSAEIQDPRVLDALQS